MKLIIKEGWEQYPYLDDVDLVETEFPLHGNFRFRYMQPDILKHIIKVLREDFIQIPPQYDNESIITYLIEEGYISNSYNSGNYVASVIRDLDPDDFVGDPEKLFCLGYLLYGEDYFNVMW